jgi:hypothetical protein
MVRRIMHQVQISSLVQVVTSTFSCTTLSQAVTLRLVVSRTVNIDLRYLSVILSIGTSILNTLSFETRS